MEITPDNIKFIFESKWIPDGTTIKVQSNHTGEFIQGTVVDCRTYPDAFLVLLGTKDETKSFYYPTDKFVYEASLLKMCKIVLLENNPDSLYHNENTFISSMKSLCI